MLAEAAGRIAAEARAIDSVGRIGGEEFAWLLPDASAAETLAAAERLRAAVRSRPFAQGLTLTASIGICDLACAPAPEQLLERADQALYWAKTTGRAWPPPAVGSASSARRARTSTRQARLHRAARVHDAGKALLSTDVLRRPGPLSTLESAHVRQHATLGAALARGALDAEQVRWVRHHHERWDGAGYPDGPSGEDIPDGARILALADAWDAMTTDRAYRPALPADAALGEVERVSGAQFMPEAGGLLRDALQWWAVTA